MDIIFPELGAVCACDRSRFKPHFPLFVFRMGYLHTGEVPPCSGKRLLWGSCRNAGEAQSHRWGGERECEGKAAGFNASLSLPACSSAA